MPITTTDKYCKSAHQYWFCFNYYCKHHLLQQAPTCTYQILYPSLTFRHNLCIPISSYLAQEVARRLIKYVNINIKCRVCTFDQFIGNCSCYYKMFTSMNRRIIDAFIFMPNLHREKIFSQCSHPRNRQVHRLIIQHCTIVSFISTYMVQKCMTKFVSD